MEQNFSQITRDIKVLRLPDTPYPASVKAKKTKILMKNTDWQTYRQTIGKNEDKLTWAEQLGLCQENIYIL